MKNMSTFPSTYNEDSNLFWVKAQIFTCAENVQQIGTCAFLPRTHCEIK